MLRLLCTADTGSDWPARQSFIALKLAKMTVIQRYAYKPRAELLDRASITLQM